MRVWLGQVRTWPQWRPALIGRLRCCKCARGPGCPRAAMETGLNWPVTAEGDALANLTAMLPQWRPALIGRLRICASVLDGLADGLPQWRPALIGRLRVAPTSSSLATASMPQWRPALIGRLRHADARVAGPGAHLAAMETGLNWPVTV